MKKLFVVDTNVVLFDHTCIYNFQEHDVALSIVVLEELDRFKTQFNQGIPRQEQLGDGLILGVEGEHPTSLGIGSGDETRAIADMVYKTREHCAQLLHALVVTRRNLELILDNLVDGVCEGILRTGVRVPDDLLVVAHEAAQGRCHVVQTAVEDRHQGLEVVHRPQ